MLNTITNEYQDQQWVINHAETLFKKNKNRSISAMFRLFRKEKHYTLFGDYILLASIMIAGNILKVLVKRKDISYASKFSKEYLTLTKADKMQWLNNLISLCWNEKKRSEAKLKTKTYRN